ncbi:MAG TPA: signal recognition particle-docking protein FtsY [Acidimicrobiia bacterium]|nr:signal recognition particle-docking protein FtsY [Acidimicrobiia bacterium]
MEDLVQPLIAVAVGVAIGFGWVFWRRRQPPKSAAPLSSKGGLSGRLARTRNALGVSLGNVFRSPELSQGLWQEMEEALIEADVGVAVAAGVVERVRRAKPDDVAGARRMLREVLESSFAGVDRSLNLDGSPAVILIVGVNGSGKTTSIAKLAGRLIAEGKRPLLAAADTFRAAADAQLKTWAERVGVPVVAGKQGSDPAAVAFDGLSAARARDKDVLIVDTAGRLHAKQHLMAELAKIRRVLERDGGKVGESLLVLDATSGQNGIAQVREFAQSVGLTGIVLTKLDGTAKGGIVVAVEQELGVPVKFVGVGEEVGDLLPFDPSEFITELLADT